MILIDADTNQKLQPLTETHNPLSCLLSTSLAREDFTEEEIRRMLRDMHEYDLEKDIVYTDELLLVNIAAVSYTHLFPYH